MVDSLLYVYPVIGGSSFEQVGENEWKAVCHDIFGTAFTLGPNTFMTAGHVLKGAAEHAFVGLGEVIDGIMHVRKVTAYEIIDSHDIGILQVPWGRSRAFPWDTTERPMLEAVHSVGYPYAIDHRNNSVGMRGFTGSIVSSNEWHDLASVPRIYELSYQCPRGLSGAPVWTVSSPVKVVGVVLGNRITEIEVYSEKETDVQGGKTVVYQKIEALHMGIAIQTAALMSIQSALLGKTIREHLQDVHLLGDNASQEAHFN